ncbi:MAG: hypothetical protein MK129_04205 [SAR116 cluster bacterium]|nr:hypothetical protein [SAR116 cluster bacterium]
MRPASPLGLAAVALCQGAISTGFPVIAASLAIFTESDVTITAWARPRTPG